MESAEIEGLSKRLIEPIPGNAPCGSEPDALPEFEELQTSIRTLTTQDAGAVDWKRTLELAAGISAARSKDLRVGSWSTLALFRLHGYAGLQAGLAFLDKLHGDWWESAYPPLKLIRARLNALESTSKRIGAWVQEDAPSASDAASCIASLAILKTLRARIGTRYAPGVSMTEVAKHLDTIEGSLSQRAFASSGAGGELSPSAGGASSGAGGKPSSRPEDLKRDTEELKKSLPEVAARLLAARASDPLAYRLLRIGLWLRPLVPAASQLLIPGPDSDEEARKKLEGLGNEPASPASLAKLEVTVAKQPYWLDLQPIVCRHLQALGADFAEAERVVRGECALLIARSSDLLDSKFAKGVRLASMETREWFRALANTKAAEGTPYNVSAFAAAPADEASPNLLAVESATAKIASGDVKGALAILAKALAEAARPRDRIELRLHLAQVMLDRGYVEGACVHLDRVDADLSGTQVRDWEPAIARRALIMLCSAYDRLPEGVQDAKARLQRARARLIELDPVVAMSGSGGKQAGK